MVKRFKQIGHGDYEMVEDETGNYVSYADYAALEKEIARLREFEWMYKDLCK